VSARASILLQEKVKQSEPWNSTRGIYADFRDGFDKPRYYCKCPNCHYVHGHYKTPREAIHKKLCQLCDARQIEKLKKDVRNVDVRKPVKRPEPKRLWVESLVEDLLAA
jgi:hypothetical protein